MHAYLYYECLYQIALAAQWYPGASAYAVWAAIVATP